LQTNQTIRVCGDKTPLEERELRELIKGLNIGDNPRNIIKYSLKSPSLSFKILIFFYLKSLGKDEFPREKKWLLFLDLSCCLHAYLYGRLSDFWDLIIIFPDHSMIIQTLDSFHPHLTTITTFRTCACGNILGDVGKEYFETFGTEEVGCQAHGKLKKRVFRLVGS
jgi:hypothetical protein